MLCSNCGKKEASHIVKRSDGEELSLCDSCYDHWGEAAAYFGNDPGFFVSLLETEENDERKCPVCGTKIRIRRESKTYVIKELRFPR